MKTITDQKIVESVLSRYQIRSFFQNQDLTFFIAWLEKGEDLDHLLDPAEHILFLLEGQISIFYTLPDGTQLNLARVTSLCMLGDMRFVESEGYDYTILVEKKSLMAVLPLKLCKDQLKNDPVFLFNVARSIRQKLIKTRIRSETAGQFKDKLVYYMRKRKYHQITSVSQTCEDLHCSRRQMQRILHNLCQEGVIERTGKGKYRLIEQENKKA